jgi:hypothetical protein
LQHLSLMVLARASLLTVLLSAQGAWACSMSNSGAYIAKRVLETRFHWGAVLVVAALFGAYALRHGRCRKAAIFLGLAAAIHPTFTVRPALMADCSVTTYSATIVLDVIVAIVALRTFWVETARGAEKPPHL